MCFKHTSKTLTGNFSLEDNIRTDGRTDRRKAHPLCLASPPGRDKNQVGQVLYIMSRPSHGKDENCPSYDFNDKWWYLCLLNIKLPRVCDKLSWILPFYYHFCLENMCSLKPHPTISWSLHDLSKLAHIMHLYIMMTTAYLYYMCI